MIAADASFSDFYNLQVVAGRALRPDEQGAVVLSESAVRRFGYGDTPVASVRDALWTTCPSKERSWAWWQTSAWVASNRKCWQPVSQPFPQTRANEARFTTRVRFRYARRQASLPQRWPPFSRLGVRCCPTRRSPTNGSTTCLPNPTRPSAAPRPSSDSPPRLRSYSPAWACSDSPPSPRCSAAKRLAYGRCWARVWRSIGMLTRDFALLVLVGFALAVPAAYVLMGRWLEGFAERAPMRAGVFLASGALVLVVALATVGWHALPSRNRPTPRTCSATSDTAHSHLLRRSMLRRYTTFCDDSIRPAPRPSLAAGRNRGYALLNGIGLTLGLSVAVLVLAYLGYERAFDHHLPHADRTYRMESNYRASWYSTIGFGGYFNEPIEGQVRLATRTRSRTDHRGPASLSLSGCQHTVRRGSERAL